MHHTFFVSRLKHLDLCSVVQRFLANCRAAPIELSSARNDGKKDEFSTLPPSHREPLSCNREVAFQSLKANFKHEVHFTNPTGIHFIAEPRLCLCRRQFMPKAIHEHLCSIHAAVRLQFIARCATPRHMFSLPLSHCLQP